MLASSRESIEEPFPAIDLVKEPEGFVATPENLKTLPFLRLPPGTTSLGHQDKAHWIRLTYDPKRYEGHDLVVVFAQPILNSVELWAEQKHGRFRIQKAGILVDRDERVVPDRLINLSLDPEADTGLLYVRIESHIFMQINATLMDLGTFRRQQTTYTFTFAAFLGAAGLLFIYNGFLWINFRKRVYGLFQAILLIHCIAHFYMSGYLFQMISPLESILMFRLFPPFIIASFAIFIRLVEVFFKSDTKRKTVRGMVYYRHLLLIVACGIFLLPTQVAASFSLPIVTITLLVTLLFLITEVSFQHMAHVYFAVGLSWFLGFGAIFILAGMGVMPFHPIIQHSVLLGSMGKLIFFSLGLASQMGILNKEKVALKAEFSAIRHQKERLLIEKQKIEEDLRTASQQLVQADKLATMGTLVAGIAHDISNPNGLTLLGHEEAYKRAESLERVTFQLLGDGDSKEEQTIKEQYRQDFKVLFEALAEIKLGAVRITEINQAIRNQARTDIESQLFSLRELFEECLLVVKSRLEGISVTLKCSEDLCLYARRSQWGQVFMNLLANAADAMEDLPDEPRKIYLSAKRASADFVEIRVEDSGPGIPPELRQKVLETFYTTKGVGKGTGLGLSIVLHILQEHRASLEIQDSVELGGACFLLHCESAEKARRAVA